MKVKDRHSLADIANDLRKAALRGDLGAAFLCIRDAENVLRRLKAEEVALTADLIRAENPGWP